jgi:hypothetical protein
MQDSRTQIIVALFGLFGAIGTTLIANWDKVFVSPVQTAVHLPSTIVTPSAVAPSASPLPVNETKPITTVLPSQPFNVAIQPTWLFIGNASTGESTFVETSSIQKSGETVDFKYRIGGEVLIGRAECSSSRWYLGKYDKWYSPSSQTTQDMLDYICR